MSMVERRVKVKVSGPRGSVDVEMLVDAGEMLTMISGELAESLGIVSEEVAEARLAGGGVKELGVGEATLEYDGVSRPVAVLVLSGLEEPLLGVTALELLRLGVSPVTSELERTDQRLYPLPH